MPTDLGSNFMQTYYRAAAATLAVFDVSSRKSFDHLKEFLIPKAQEIGIGRPDWFLVIVGAKSDIQSDKDVKSLSVVAGVDHQNLETIKEKKRSGAPNLVNINRTCFKHIFSFLQVTICLQLSFSFFFNCCFKFWFMIDYVG